MCPSGTTCVDQHCVAPCDMNGMCPAGEVCVDNGCIPDQKPNAFVCTTEGMQDACASGSICIHHSCYTTCDPTADANMCNTAELPECKSITTGSGTYNLCGSSSNFGSDCDPTVGKSCTNPLLPVCIDGYCR
jgi:hypothetical protein